MTKYNGGITVNELAEACNDLVSKGLGEKHVLIVDDDEGNGYHTLFYLFEYDQKVINETFTGSLACNLHDDNDINNVVLLG